MCAALIRVQAQDHEINISGIYLTDGDFRYNRLSEVATVDRENYMVVALNKLKCYRNGQPMNFRLRDIYGYYQNGVKYRVFRRQTFFDRYACYQVIDESGVVVYARKAHGHKRGGYTFYYWSADSTSPITRITKKNVRKAFAGHPEFVKQVSEEIRRKTLYVPDERGKTRFNVYYQRLMSNDINL